MTVTRLATAGDVGDLDRLLAGDDVIVGAAVLTPPVLDDDVAVLVALAGEEQDALVAAAARHAGDLGWLSVRDPSGAIVDVPPPGDSLPERFLRLAARAATLAAVAVGSAAGVGPVARKSDGSVLIEADAAADAVATEVLSALGATMLSEEHDDPDLDDPGDPWIVVDPLDGTGNFLAGLPPWAFSAGLVAGGRALAGYVCDLSSGRRWWGAVDHGAFRDGHSMVPRAGATVVVPTPPAGGVASVPEGFRRLRITGCTAVDLCLVADGSAGAWHDLDRQGTHVHDVAGALGVLAAAGGVVRGPDGAPLPLMPDTEGLIRFAAAADETIADALVAAHR